MTRSLICWLGRLVGVPSHLHTNEVLARAEADKARAELARAQAHEPLMRRLADALETDRTRNHYGEGIAAQLRGGKPE